MEERLDEHNVQLAQVSTNEDFRILQRNELQHAISLLPSQ